jgi:hypothetical protein
MLVLQPLQFVRNKLQRLFKEELELRIDRGRVKYLIQAVQLVSN